MDQEDGIELVGALIMRRVDVGSKSECDGFFIVTDDNEEVQVEIIGDNPFDQPALRSLLGARCKATGCVPYRGRYLIKKIFRV